MNDLDQLRNDVRSLRAAHNPTRLEGVLTRIVYIVERQQSQIDLLKQLLDERTQEAAR